MIPANFKFCPYCGSAVTNKCPNCGMELSDKFAF